MSGASGQALRGNAAVFEIGPESARRVWSAPPEIGNVRAYADAPDSRWEVGYVDMKRFYGYLPKAVPLDIFQAGWDSHAYRRLVHQPLD
jgi:hypothetical protein